MKTNAGLVYVFTGEGKGKTSAALGTAMRAVGEGMTVAWVAFYKQASWKLSEVSSLKKLGVKTYLLGKGFHIGEKHKRIAAGAVVVDTASEAEHKAAAAAALKKAASLLGKVEVLVLDEVNNAVADGLISVEQVEQVVASRAGTHVILTGRGVDKKIVALADLVTEMKKVKHPYDVGKLAVKGLDF